MTVIAPLFVPAHVQRLRASALNTKADAFILDLEDAVPPQEKAAARQGAVDFIRQRPQAAFVRINPARSRNGINEYVRDDIAAVVMPGIRGLFVPKVETLNDLEEIETAIDAAEDRAGLVRKSVGVCLILETALGVVNMAQLASAPSKRRRFFAFGGGDFTTDLGIDWSRAESELSVPRAMLPIISKANGLLPPLDTVFVDLNDSEGLRESAIRGKSLGYRGKCVIHPKQIEIVRDVYTPSENDIRWAQKVIEAAEAASRDGSGAFVIDGKMVDEPIVARARALLDAARAINGENL